MANVSNCRRVVPFVHREEGQAAIEFLLVLPIFVLFLLLLVDLGVVMYEFVSVSNAAREGARYGAVNCGTGTCSEDSVQARVAGRSGGILCDPNTDPGCLDKYEIGWINEDGTGTNSDRGDSVVVKIHHTYEFLFFPAITMDVRSCADMRLEQKDRTATALPAGSGCP